MHHLIASLHHWLTDNRDRLFWYGIFGLMVGGVFPWARTTLCLIGLLCLGLFLASFFKRQT